MLMTTIEAEQRLLLNIKASIPTMLWGPPGVGKSDLVRQVAKKLGYGYIDFRATLRDPVDLRGLPMIDEKTGTARWLAPDELPQEKRDGKFGIFHMDELPQATDSMQKGCYSLVLDGHLGEYKKPGGWICVGCGNRMQDRSGASRMLKALANRFMHIDIGVDVPAWRKWAAEVNLNPLVEAFIAFRPALLHKMDDADENAFPTPRAWEKVAKIADEKDERVRFLGVAGLVGEAAAVEFEGFVRVWSRLPSIDQIFLDPQSVHVPGMQEPALLYAVASAVSRRATPKNFANGIAYARRLPKEHEVMCISGAVRREPKLKETKAFGDWYAANSDVLI